MKSFQIFMYLILVNLCLVVNLHAQSNQNTIESIKSVYEALESNDISSLTDDHYQNEEAKYRVDF